MQEFDVELRRDVVKRVALYGNQPAAPSSPATAGSGVSTPSPAFKKAGMLGKSKAKGMKATLSFVQRYFTLTVRQVLFGRLCG